LTDQIDQSIDSKLSVVEFTCRTLQLTVIKDRCLLPRAVHQGKR
jgi:hypothetical protein